MRIKRIDSLPNTYLLNAVKNIVLSKQSYQQIPTNRSIQVPSMPHTLTSNVEVQ